MTKVRLPPIGFFSYARQDDELSGKRLSRLRALIKAELQQQYGRTPVRLFQDVTTIPFGADWEHRIRDALDQSTFFVPIITPSFIQSKWCCTETDIFLRQERRLFEHYPDLHKQSRIFPIDYRAIRDGNAFSPTILTVLRRRLWFSFQDLRDKDPTSETVSRAIGSFAESICDLLQVEVEKVLTGDRLVGAAHEPAADLRARAPAAGPTGGIDMGASISAASVYREGELETFRLSAILSRLSSVKSVTLAILAAVGIGIVAWSVPWEGGSEDRPKVSKAAVGTAPNRAPPVPKANVKGDATAPFILRSLFPQTTIHLGGFSDRARAETAWTTLTERFSYLRPLTHTIEPVVIAGRTLYRLRATGPDAADFCRRLNRAGVDCTVLPPPSHRDRAARV